MITNLRHEVFYYMHEATLIKELVTNNICNINCNTLKDSYQLACDFVNANIQN